MTFCRFIKGGGNNLRIHVPGHVGYFFRTLVDQQNDHIHFGVISCNGIGHILQQNCFTGLGLGNN